MADVWDYDVKCSKGYGIIKFVGVTESHCPVSGAEDCKSCDMPEPKSKLGTGKNF